MELSQTGGKYITFQLSGKYFAMPAGKVREMMPMQPVAPWAVKIDGVLGAIQSRGRVIPLFDLRAELRLKERASSRQQSLLIVKTHDAYEFGFPVDKVTDLIHVNHREIRELTIVGHGRVRSIVDIDALIDQERLVAVAFASRSFSSG